MKLKSLKSMLRLAFEPESILLCLAFLRVAYNLWDRGDYWSRWNIETEDSLFILIAAAALRINKLWSYVVAILICVLVLAGIYSRWLGNWEFVFAHYEHHIAQIIFSVAISSYAVACIAHKKGRKRVLR